METYRKNLKQIGSVLIVLGLLDICWMIYCISHNISYASSFNFFAVIAGIFLYRGNAKTAAIAAWFSAFFHQRVLRTHFLNPPYDTARFIESRDEKRRRFICCRVFIFHFSHFFVGLGLQAFDLSRCGRRFSSEGRRREISLSESAKRVSLRQYPCCRS